MNDHQDQQRQAELETSRRKTCRHYNGLEAACDVGIDYEAKFGSEAGIRFRLPCLPALKEGDALYERAQDFTRGECERHELLSDEEWDERQRELSANTEAALTAVDLALATMAEYPNEDQGTIECPTCSQLTLRWARNRRTRELHSLACVNGCVSAIQ